MPQERLFATARFDKELAWYRGDSVRYLAVEVTAAALQRKEEVRRPALNLALVIDASGSMSGGKLSAAKEAARLVLEQLTDGDTLSLVSFAEDVLVHAGAVTLNAVSRIEVRHALAAVTTRGNTDLGAGWLHGAKCVAESASFGATQSHVIVLSDGHANAGITNPDTLAKDAAALLKEGIPTSTVGIGDGYSTEQLIPLAEAGGGTFHDAQFPEEIAQVVLAELKALREMVAEDVTIAVSCPENVRMEQLGRFPGSVSGNAAMFSLGGLVSEAKRSLVLRIQCPPGQVDTVLEFEARVSFVPAGKSGRMVLQPVHATLTFAQGKTNTPQPRDQGVALIAATAWHSAIIRTVTVMNRDGAVAQAEAYFASELPQSEKYCAGLPGTDELVSGLNHLRRAVNRRWTERSRKEMELHGYQASTAKMDRRAQLRPGAMSAILEFDDDPTVRARPRPRRSAPATLPLTLENGHPIVRLKGVTALVDTGAPQSIGNGASLVLPGRTVQPAGSFIGLDIKEVSGWVGLPIDVLLGMDALGLFEFGLDLPAGHLTLAGPGEVKWQGKELPYQSLGGVPTIDVAVNGHTIRAFLDTGAKLSYVTPAFVAGVVPVRSERDFYPGFGVFETEVRELSLAIGGETVSMDFGVLPAAISGLLGATGVQAIIGAQLLHSFRVAFQPSAGRVIIDRL